MFLRLTGVVPVLAMTMVLAVGLAAVGVPPPVGAATPPGEHGPLSVPQVSFTGPMPRASAPAGATVEPSHRSALRLVVPFHAVGAPDFDIAMMNGSPLVK